MPEYPQNSGAEPLYGPAAYTGRAASAGDGTAAAREEIDGQSPPYTAPYPPYPYDPPAPQGITTPVASGLAYFTVIPAVFFLLLEPYRSNREVRFHSWQSILLMLAAMAVRIVERVLESAAPALVAYAIIGVVGLALFAIWLIAVIRAFDGGRWLIPGIGPVAENIAAGRSV